MNRTLWGVLLVGGMLLLAACNANSNKEMNDKPATEMKDEMKDGAMMNEDNGVGDKMKDDTMMNENKGTKDEDGKMMDETKANDGM